MNAGIPMTFKFTEPGLEVNIVPSQQPTGLYFEADQYTASPSNQEAIPNLASEEYRLLYLPTMLGVFTARHQQMPLSNELLHVHVFGTKDHAGCDACREETEFLVAHQKKFF